MEKVRCAQGWRTRCAAVVLGLLAAGAAWGDDIYRWKDRDGRVNYGSVPPAGVTAERIDPGAVSVVPVPPRPRPQADVPDTARRLDRLESELEDERRLRRDAEARADEQAERRARAREECEERLREPCDEEGRPLASPYVIVPPYGVRPPHRHGDRWPPPVRPPRVVQPDGMPKPVLPIAPARPARGQPVIPE